MMTTLLSTLAMVALATADLSPTPRQTLDALLARPVSPGAVALLLPHAADARAASRVVEALSHPEAAVRAAAARVASVADIRSAGPAIRRALESETDRSAAAEQIRAAAVLIPAGDDASLVAAARRLSLVDVLALTWGVVRGPAALTLIDLLREAGHTENARTEFLAAATHQGREGLNVAAASAVRTGDARMWSAVLALAREPGAELAPSLLIAALGSPKPEIRAVVYWYLALTLANGVALRPELEAAIALTPELVTPESPNVDAAFALVVLRRAQKGRQFGGDWGARAASGTPVIPLGPRDDGHTLSRLLTKTEARALSRRMTQGRDDGMLEREAGPPEKLGEIDGKEYGGLTFAGGLPPGTLRDLLAVTGCRPAGGARAVGFVDYRPDGRPRRISVSANEVRPDCAAVAGPALSLTLAPPRLFGAALERRTVLIIPLDEEALKCADEGEAVAPEMAPEEGATSPEKIEAPRKVKNVAPWYPGRAREQRREGTVVLEAVVNPSGCIRSARVTRGVAPDLDAVAMIAVGQWRYTPTVFRGKAVPVIMTVSVNFTLR